MLKLSFVKVAEKVALGPCVWGIEFCDGGEHAVSFECMRGALASMVGWLK